jgi:hypothetical protein
VPKSILVSTLFFQRRGAATAWSFRGGNVYPGAGSPHLVFQCLPAVLERAAAATTVAIAQDSVAAVAAAAVAAARARAHAPPAAVAAAAAAIAVAVDDAAVPTSEGGGTAAGGCAAAFPDGAPPLDWALVPDGASAARGPPTGAGASADADMEGEGGGGTAEDVEGGRRRCFVADGALGRLARWLRCLGVDAEHVPSGAAGQYGPLLALAARDDRVILTRDRRLLLRKDCVGAYLVEDDDPKRQLAQVTDDPRPLTVNPIPSAPNPQHQNFNPTSCILNPKP